MSPQHKAWLKCCPPLCPGAIAGSPMPTEQDCSAASPRVACLCPRLFPPELEPPGSQQGRGDRLVFAHADPPLGASHHISAGSRGRLLPEPSLLCPCPLPFSELLAPNPPWFPDPVAVSAPTPRFPWPQPSGPFIPLAVLHLEAGGGTPSPLHVRHSGQGALLLGVDAP